MIGIVSSVRVVGAKYEDIKVWPRLAESKKFGPERQYSLQDKGHVKGHVDAQERKPELLVLLHQIEENMPVKRIAVISVIDPFSSSRDS